MPRMDKSLRAAHIWLIYSFLTLNRAISVTSWSNIISSHVNSRHLRNTCHLRRTMTVGTTRCSFTGTSQELTSHNTRTTLQCSESHSNAVDVRAMQLKYMERIGLTAEDIDNLLSRKEPDLANLQRLLTAHLLTVPFENLDQHSHPEFDAAPHIPRRPEDRLPSLDVTKSLRKICHDNRGGFCYELNLSFAWLLRSFGYRARLAVADVGCSQAIPAHVIILVDGLIKEPDVPVLVDVGFGTPAVCDVVLPLAYDEAVLDTQGDSFRFSKCDETERFDTALYRKRIVTCEESNSEDEGEREIAEEPMYRFDINDDMANNAEEFILGLHHVLNHSPTFTGKRLCVLSTVGGGHVTLADGYIKWMERGKAVKTFEFDNELQWRNALSDHFDIVLFKKS